MTKEKTKSNKIKGELKHACQRHASCSGSYLGSQLSSITAREIAK